MHSSGKKGPTIKTTRSITGNYRASVTSLKWDVYTEPKRYKKGNTHQSHSLFILLPSGKSNALIDFTRLYFPFSSLQAGTMAAEKQLDRWVLIWYHKIETSSESEHQGNIMLHDAFNAHLGPFKTVGVLKNTSGDISAFGPLGLFSIRSINISGFDFYLKMARKTSSSEAVCTFFWEKKAIPCGKIPKN